MRRNRLLMMMLAALLLWWAVQVVPQALAFKAATVKFAGTAQVVTVNALFYCTPPAFSTVPRGKRSTGTLTCWNNTDVDIVVNVPAGTVSPAGRAATVRWGTPACGRTSTTISVPKGTARTATMCVIPPAKAVRIQYTYTFTTSVSAPNGLDYTKTHKVTFTPQ